MGCITGGVNWWEVQRLLLDISVAYALLFILFVLVTVLAAMNVITGIFVNDAVEMASLDSDNKVQQEMDQNRHYLQKLLELFQKIDTTHRGSITLETFLQQMQREEVKLNFAMLGLDVSDPMAFFSLLDVDGSVELEIDEFVMGCMRFRNNPGNVNLECSVLEAKQLMKKSLARQKHLEQKVGVIEELVGGLCTALTKQRTPGRTSSDARSRSDETLSSSSEPPDEPFPMPHASPPALFH